jgi:hypothetical protein
MMEVRIAAGATADGMRVLIFDRLCGRKKDASETTDTRPASSGATGVGPPRPTPYTAGSGCSCSGCRGQCNGSGSGTGTAYPRRIEGQLPETSTVAVSVRAGIALLPCSIPLRSSSGDMFLIPFVHPCWVAPAMIARAELLGRSTRKDGPPRPPPPGLRRRRTTWTGAPNAATTKQAFRYADLPQPTETMQEVACEIDPP